MSSSNWRSAADLTAKIAQLRQNASGSSANRSDEKLNAQRLNGKRTYVPGRGHLAYWAAQSLRTGEAAICLDCGGTGSGQFDLCVMCQGKGAVCPSCHGMRFLHLRRRGATPWAAAEGSDGHSIQADVARCPDCCEGNNVNELLELGCIRRYIARSDAVQDAVQPTLGDAQ